MVAVLAYIAIDFTNRRKLDAFGLFHVEDIGIAKANKNAGVLLGDVLLGFFIGLALDPDDGSENADALLALLHAAAYLVPCVHPGYFRGGRALSRDLKDIPEGIRMKAAHRIQVGGKCIRVPGL